MGYAVLRKEYKIENINNKMRDWLEDIIYENNCILEATIWKSKYSDYMVYDEPMLSNGFDITYILTSSKVENVKFVKHLYDRRLCDIAHLNNCHSINE